MIKRFFYDSGLPFSDVLPQNLLDIKRRVLDDNKAGMIVIDGGVGEGKTTLAILVSNFLQGAYRLENDKYVMDKLHFTNFELQLAMGGEDFILKLKACYKAGLFVVIYDESGDFNRRGSLSKFNAMINRVFDTYRAFKIIVILCLPSFHVLDSDLLDKKIPRLLLHCFDRNNLYGNYQGYSLYRMFYLQDKMKKLIVKPFAYDLVEENFRGHFLDLPSSVSDALNKFSVAGKMDILDSAEIKFSNLMSYNDIARRLNKSLGWVKKTMGRLKLPFKKVIKNKRYFEDYVLDELLNQIERK